MNVSLFFGWFSLELFFDEWKVLWEFFSFLSFSLRNEVSTDYAVDNKHLSKAKAKTKREKKKKCHKMSIKRIEWSWEVRERCVKQFVDNYNLNMAKIQLWTGIVYSCLCISLDWTLQGKLLLAY